MLSNSNNGLMTTQVNDFLKEIPNKQRHFLGKVVERFEDNTDNTDDKPRNYKIKFNILGLPDFQNEWPIAMPLGDMVREVKVDEIVFIYDICVDNMAAHTFFYVPIREGNGEERFLGLQNYDNKVDLTKCNKVVFKLPNFEMTFSRGTDNDADSNEPKADGTDGSIEIKSGGSTITIDGSSGNITIKGKTGAVLTLDGYVQNTTGFTAIPTCPYSGAPHCINTVLFQ